MACNISYATDHCWDNSVDNVILSDFKDTKTSNNSKYQLSFASTRNDKFVLLVSTVEKNTNNTVKYLWVSREMLNKPDTLVFQTDGNLVVYKSIDDKNIPLFNTGTSVKINKGNVCLQNDANLVIYDPEAIWASMNSTQLEGSFMSINRSISSAMSLLLDIQHVDSFVGLYSRNSLPDNMTQQGNTDSRSFALNIKNETANYCMGSWSGTHQRTRSTGVGGVSDCYGAYFEPYTGDANPGQAQSVYFCSDDVYAGAFGKVKFNIYPYNQTTSSCDRTKTLVSDVIVTASTPFSGDNSLGGTVNGTGAEASLCLSSSMSSVKSEMPYGIVTLKSGGCTND
jgi:hypothetical protein